MNDSEHAFIASDVQTNFGKNMGQSQVDLERLREAHGELPGDPPRA